MLALHIRTRPPIETLPTIISYTVCNHSHMTDSSSGLAVMLL